MSRGSKFFGSEKKDTSSFHPQTDGMVKRLNHTLCEILYYVMIRENRAELLLHAIATHSINVVRRTGLAPNEVHIRG